MALEVVCVVSSHTVPMLYPERPWQPSYYILIVAHLPCARSAVLDLAGGQAVGSQDPAVVHRRGVGYLGQGH